MIYVTETARQLAVDAVHGDLACVRILYDVLQEAEERELADALAICAQSRGWGSNQCLVLAALASRPSATEQEDRDLIRATHWSNGVPRKARHRRK